MLSAALAAGGDYADLYFEFRVSADYALEEEQVRSVGRSISRAGSRQTLQWPLAASERDRARDRH